MFDLSAGPIDSPSVPAFNTQVARFLQLYLGGKLPSILEYCMGAGKLAALHKDSGVH